MKFLIMIALVGFIFADTSFATTKSPTAQTLSGTLADKMCAKRLKGDATKLASHTKMCMTEEMCATSGYGIVVDGVFYKFDKKGDQLATTLLSKTTKASDIRVEVTGTVNGTTIKVTSLKEKA
jgi:hypothetical protein